MAGTITEWKNWSRAQSLADTSRGSTDQTAITPSGTSQQSAAFETDTVAVTYSAGEDCHVKCGGTSPTATTNSQRIGAGTSVSWAVQGGDKLAVIEA